MYLFLCKRNCISLIMSTRGGYSRYTDTDSGDSIQTLINLDLRVYAQDFICATSFVDRKTSWIQLRCTKLSLQSSGLFLTSTARVPIYNYSAGILCTCTWVKF
jgi:hypothetical protein